MNPERSREAMEVVGVVGEQVGPFEAAPFPDRLVDVNGASARRRGRTAVVAPVHGAGPRALANAGRDAAGDVSGILCRPVIASGAVRLSSGISSDCPRR